VHVFVENDPSRKLATMDDLDKYYTKDILDGAWKNFTGGYKELNRSHEEIFIINFELYLDNDTYLGRQVTKIEGDWLLTLRLVVPNNNSALLDTLQSMVIPRYHVWTQATIVPLSWASIADSAAGYIIKYPPDWKRAGGSPGSPYTVVGTLGSNNVFLETQAIPNKSVKTDADARAWVMASWPKATIQTVSPATSGQTTGFAISYANVDTDGNQASAVVTLLNGANGTLYVANLQSSARGQDFLAPANSSIPIELTEIRNTFMILPSDQLVATAIPSPTAVSTAAATALPVTPAASTVVPTPTVLPPTSVPATQAPTLPATAGAM
jgi:hypothetical protein